MASNENSLIVYINAFKSENYKVNEETTQFRESFVGINWSKQTPLTKYEISPIKGIFDKIHIITWWKNNKCDLFLAWIRNMSNVCLPMFKKANLNFRDNLAQSIE